MWLCTDISGGWTSTQLVRKKAIIVKCSINFDQKQQQFSDILKIHKRPLNILLVYLVCDEVNFSDTLCLPVSAASVKYDQPNNTSLLMVLLFFFVIEKKDCYFYRYCSLKMLAKKWLLPLINIKKNYCIHVILKMRRGNFSLKGEGMKKIRKVLVSGEIPPGIDD